MSTADSTASTTALTPAMNQTSVNSYQNDTEMENCTTTTPVVNEPFDFGKNIQLLISRTHAKVQEGYPTSGTYIQELKDLRASITELQALKLVIQPSNATTIVSNPIAAVKNTDDRHVPSHVPYFQWSGAVTDTTKPVFPSFKACMNCFEDVLHAYQLDLNQHGLRLLIICLPTAMRDWMQAAIQGKKNLPWEDYREALSLEYGVTQDAEQEVNTNALLLVHPAIPCTRFISALPLILADRVTLALATAPRDTKRNLTYVMSLTRDLSNQFAHRDAANDDARPTPMPLGSAASKYTYSTPRTNLNHAARHQRRVRGPFFSGAMYCSHHGTSGHNTPDCRATNNHNNNMSRPTRNCYTCAAEWTPSHRCPNARSRNNVRFYSAPTTAPTTDAHHLPSSQRSPPKSHVDEAPTLSFPFVQDEDLPSLQPFHGKSNITINDEPASLNDRTNSIIIPVTIQNYKCWAYVDSGSNFSSLKPSLASKLGLTPSLPTPIALNKSSLLQSKNHTISLGDANSSIERIGFIDNVHLFYNNLHIHHTFEVFNLNSEADVCIGTDHMSKMNINITGLTTTWDEHVVF
ncbi:uncharacterized protein EV154DRAFT_567603 [Mucor mucedo]|uniref:uncharacterized protein n=1 Tax=Mucor mucedo TaxID=29922 RepID=UPI0022202BEB|nr:uncharacterized protein EV154DRAFT_567603 [Mucor mucedo]KAI7886553.1 hypothetical protein EV154DRAFT_567603 [Mucor mucedo]